MHVCTPCMAYDRNLLLWDDLWCPTWSKRDACVLYRYIWECTVIGETKFSNFKSQATSWKYNGYWILYFQLIPVTWCVWSMWQENITLVTIFSGIYTPSMYMECWSHTTVALQVDPYNIFWYSGIGLSCNLAKLTVIETVRNALTKCTTLPLQNIHT